MFVAAVGQRWGKGARTRRDTADPVCLGLGGEENMVKHSRNSFGVDLVTKQPYETTANTSWRQRGVGNTNTLCARLDKRPLLGGLRSSSRHRLVGYGTRKIEICALWGGPIKTQAKGSLKQNLKNQNKFSSFLVDGLPHVRCGSAKPHVRMTCFGHESAGVFELWGSFVMEAIPQESAVGTP